MKAWQRKSENLKRDRKSWKKIKNKKRVLKQNRFRGISKFKNKQKFSEMLFQAKRRKIRIYKILLLNYNPILENVKLLWHP